MNGGRTAERTTGAILVCALALALGTERGGQDRPLVGFVPKDRVVELAAAADPATASFTPSPTALAYFVTLVDPVHLRVFLRASRPADLRLAAAVGRSVDAAANEAFAAEFIAVADDLTEPTALLADNKVTEVPEIIVFWLGEEIARLHPAAGAVVEEDLAASIHAARTQIAGEMLLDNDFFRNIFHSDLTALECKRCHGPR